MDPAETQVSTPGGGHLDKGWAGDPEHRGAQAHDHGGDRRCGHDVHRGVAAWLAAERARLRTHAEAIEVTTMEQLRAQRLQQGAARGARLALRIRDPRRPGGSFTIEWFRVRGRGRTEYLPRGAADAYARAAFAGVLPWERQIALAAEQTLGPIRQRLRLMKALELRLGVLVDLLQRAPTPVAGDPGAGARWPSSDQDHRRARETPNSQEP